MVRGDLLLNCFFFYECMCHYIWILFIEFLFQFRFSILQNSLRTLWLSMSKTQMLFTTYIYIFTSYKLYYIMSILRDFSWSLWIRYVECTSSAMQTLVIFRNLYPEHRREEIDGFLTDASGYLEKMQTPDGSWFISDFIITQSEFLKPSKLHLFINLN